MNFLKHSVDSIDKILHRKLTVFRCVFTGSKHPDHYSSHAYCHLERKIAPRRTSSLVCVHWVKGLMPRVPTALLPSPSLPFRFDVSVWPKCSWVPVDVVPGYFLDGEWCCRSASLRASLDGSDWQSTCAHRWLLWQRLGASLRSLLWAPVVRSYWRDGSLAPVVQPGKPADAPHSCAGTSKWHFNFGQKEPRSGPDCNPRQSSHKLHLNRVIPNEVLSLIFS